VECPASGGAAFEIALPVGEFDSSDAAAEAASALATSGRAVLVVDDEPEIRDTLRDILASARHRVVCVASGREALESIASHHFDVILTDIRMPDGDGRRLFEEIRRRWPRQASRVVFVTGDTLASDLRAFVAATGLPIIEKPFLPDDVRRMVSQIALSEGRETKEANPRLT